MAGLCAGWVAVQLLAKHQGTKNHFDHAHTCCGLCISPDKERCKNRMICELDDQELEAENQHPLKKKF